MIVDSFNDLEASSHVSPRAVDVYHYSSGVGSQSGSNSISYFIGDFFLMQALTNAEKSGCGVIGRDLNSG